MPALSTASWKGCSSKLGWLCGARMRGALQLPCSARGPCPVWGQRPLKQADGTSPLPSSCLTLDSIAHSLQPCILNSYHCGWQTWLQRETIRWVWKPLIISTCVPIVSQDVGENHWSDSSCLALFRTDVDSQATEQKIHYGTVGYHFVFDFRLLSVWKVNSSPAKKYHL